MLKFLNQKITILNAFLVLVLLILIEVVTVTQIDLNNFNQTSTLKVVNTGVSKPQPPLKTVANTPQSTSSAKTVSKPSMPANYGRSISVPILMYHYIGNNPNPADKLRDNLSVAPDIFEKQMTHLASHGYTPITLDTLYAGLKKTAGLPNKPIILTFDDGYIDFYINAFPILQRFNFHAVSFIPTGLMDQGYYLHWDQIKQMDATGLISFQAHSVNHYNLPSLNQQQLIYQVTQSKKILESQLGKPVNFMAYPYGTSDERVWAATKAAGYLGSAGTWYGTVETEGTIYDMPRVKIAGGLSLARFASMFP